MNYQEALDYIHGTLKFGSKLGLHNISSLLELMGNPHKKLKFVHVAGTNGKGSTTAFISSILSAAGYKTGVYTSPYIQRFTERICVNNFEISADALARITSLVKEKVDIMLSRGENHPTEFEIVTAIGFQYFYEQNCDIVVLEVGLGGRYDSTNVIDTPEVAVITTISFDHMAILGDTLPKIAYEKAGIIKEFGDLVLYPHEEQVEKVFYDICNEKKCNLTRVDFNGVKAVSFGIYGQVFDMPGYKGLEISLLGEHQIKNAVTAVTVAGVLQHKGYKLTEETVRQGLKNASWPGRLEVLREKPVFLIDGAHNEEGAQVLVEALKSYFPGKCIKFIFGVLKDKEIYRILEIISPVAHSFILVTPDSPRAMEAAELSAIVKRYCKNVTVSDTIEAGVRTTLDQASEDDVICAFGSLYYIGEVRGLLNG